MYLWSTDNEAVYTSMSCFNLLCEEADIRCSSDDITMNSLLPNYQVYQELAQTTSSPFNSEWNLVLAHFQSTRRVCNSFTVHKKVFYLFRSRYGTETYNGYLKEIGTLCERCSACKYLLNSRKKGY